MTWLRGGVEDLASALGSRALALAAEVTNEARMTGVAELAIVTSGSLDFVLNNAGIALFPPIETIASGKRAGPAPRATPVRSSRPATLGKVRAGVRTHGIAVSAI